MRPSLAVNSLQKCSHGHFNLTQDHNIFSTSCTSESNPGTRNFTNRTLTAGRQKRTVVRLSHDETWKSETEPRQYIQLSRLSKGMTRHEKPCYETRHMSQDSTTASSKRSKLSTPIHLSPLLKKVLVTGSIARSATCRYLIYSEADFEVFRHAGRHAAQVGVKYRMEEGTAKFHPHRCNNKAVGPQKLKFLLRYDQNVEYKRPCAIFTKFAEFVPHFRMR